MASKLTPWFPGDVKPVREGVYEVWTGIGEQLDPPHSAFSYFDGTGWNGSWNFSNTAFSERFFREATKGQGSCEWLIRWRGLSAPSKVEGGK